VIPRPSHPSNSSIVWGNKIRNIIDITNSTTRMMNRSEVLSFTIYVLVNCITLLAMVNTVAIKIVLVGSKIIGSVIEVLESSVIVHSTSIL